MSTAEHVAAVDKAVFPGLQGGPHNHTTADIAVARKETSSAGLTEQHMPLIAGWLDEAVAAAVKDDGATLDRIAADVRDLLQSFPTPGYTGQVEPARWESR